MNCLIGGWVWETEWVVCSHVPPDKWCCTYTRHGGWNQKCLSRGFVLMLLASLWASVTRHCVSEWRQCEVGRCVTVFFVKRLTPSGKSKATTMVTLFHINILIFNTYPMCHYPSVTIAANTTLILLAYKASVCAVDTREFIFHASWLPFDSEACINMSRGAGVVWLWSA